MMDSSSSPAKSSKAWSPASTSSSSHGFTLHLFTDLNVHFHIFSYASIDTDRFPFIELAFAVVFRHTFSRAGLCQPI